MREAWILTRKELKSAFDNPTAYVVLSIFLLITGWFMGSTLFLQNVASLQPVLDLVPIIYMFFIPALTMGTIAEERRSGTIELLLTLPLRDHDVVLGKWLSASLLMAAGLTGTLFYVVILSLLGDPDTGAIVGGYLGMLLLGMACTALGILASSFTRNQMVAFILGFTFIFALTLIDKIAVFFPAWMGGLLQYLSLDFHYQNLLRGVIDTRDLIYYLSVVTFSGFLTVYHLNQRPD